MKELIGSAVGSIGKGFVAEKKNVLTISFVLFCTLNTIGQNINRQQVNRLLIQLQKSRADESRIHSLVELGKFHIYKPGETKIDLDSGLTYLHQAKKLSDSLHLVRWQHEVESMLVIADMEGKNHELGQLRFRRLLDECQRTGDKRTEAVARFRNAIWLRNVDKEYSHVISQFVQAATLYRSLNDQKNEILALKEIAVTYLIQGDNDIAEAQLLDVLKRYKAINYPKLHDIYNLLAVVARLNGELNKGLLYSLLCIDNMSETGDTTSAATYYGDLAKIYIEIGNYGKGMEWYRKSLTKWRQERQPNYALYNTAGVISQDLIAHHKPQEALRLINTLVNEIPTNTMIQKGCVAQNLAYCYEALYNYPLAEKYYLEAISWYNRNKLDSEKAQKAHQDIGSFYFKQKRLTKASYHLEKALSILPQKNALLTVRNIHYMLFKIDSIQGNYLSAIGHFRQHKAINDSLFNETKSKQIAGLQIQYDTRQKEQNIELLTKQSKLQQSELKRGQSTRNGIIAASLLLAGLLGVSYNQFRLKKRSNQLLQTQQIEINQKNQSLSQLLEEKEWMLKEIHHRVKNNLQVITSLLNSQSSFLHDSTALAAIRESQNRVHAMALIHQKLYQSDNLALIDMQQYICDILDHLIDSFNRQHSVQKQVSISTIQLDVTLATPLGLIINEAVTNSLKYAFPENRPGTISVSFRSLENQGYLLTITDDGIGWPTGFNAKQNKTLGLSMIRGLSRQIGGRLAISQHEGVHISLEFSQTKKVSSGRDVA
ncbi:tetratricopeptide repeat protein [Spirosoma validum]|uniref:histidine kinase n=1 Tax=Spirosoma validum TaxID=2771355 RepID=A0A927B8T9_9BACT|nr:tetratricopeptide repeat protein [Spirosoma validum]MBD2757257.1 histidine kinase [Spirosoma validum]